MISFFIASNVNIIICTKSILKSYIKASRQPVMHDFVNPSINSLSENFGSNYRKTI